ncbi:hypothetical protein SMB554_23105 (plasmid) [Sinorhizobium meliloti]|nr:hypothetical protein SMB554_23105 [Sinorhizobium meliloti]
MTACRQGVARLSQATSAVAGDFMSSGSLGTVAPTIADIVPYAGRVLVAAFLSRASRHAVSQRGCQRFHVDGPPVWAEADHEFG